MRRCKPCMALAAYLWATSCPLNISLRLEVGWWIYCSLAIVAARDMQFAISYAVGKFECVLCPDVLEIPEMLQGCFNIKWD
ncbi:hypothetical protein L207DRAFT_305685 [Hyaloscypha variabilis F]|uniref:Uncharacterized protein n=1 Tax=Hyaloscypha variabilis (strain UAMH 11265 / GT02V1 / F) TaxID=1149755 RepID=A0A2J6RU61_HYAVF|nr:hypothetical protein L207DRAFT_305685 [Hyaloscypha variabilis F]